MRPIVVLFSLLILLILAPHVFASGTVIYQDDFNAGNFNGWGGGTGSWSASTNELVGGQSDGASIGTHAPLNVGALASDENYNIFWQFNMGTTTSDFADFTWMADTTNSATFAQGYRLYIRADGAGFGLGKVNAAAILTGSAPNTGIVDVNVVLNSLGDMTVFINGTRSGNIRDTTWSSGNKIVAQSFNGSAGEVGAWDNFKILRCTSNSCAIAGGGGGSPSYNHTPDLNVNYPNSNGLTLYGVHSFDFNFFDVDFNTLAHYDFNIAVHRVAGGATTKIATDKNAFSFCSNMDSNLTNKNCQYSFDFSNNLLKGVLYIADVNLSDSNSTVIASASNSFTVTAFPMDINLNFPNSSSLVLAPDVNSFDFNFSIADFNVNRTYDFNIDVRNFSSGAKTRVATDQNMFAKCSNMDLNSTAKHCTFDYNFGALSPSTNYRWDLNVAVNHVDLYSSSSTNSFTVSSPGSTPNVPPVVNITYPNSNNLSIVDGNHNFTFTFTDSDFNVMMPYDFNITLKNLDTNGNITIVQDRNAFLNCTNMVGAGTTKTCTYQYDFNHTILDSNNGYLATVKVSDGEDTTTKVATYSFVVSAFSSGYTPQYDTTDIPAILTDLLSGIFVGLVDNIGVVVVLLILLIMVLRGRQIVDMLQDFIHSMR